MTEPLARVAHSRRGKTHYARDMQHNLVDYSLVTSANLNQSCLFLFKKSSLGDISLPPRLHPIHHTYPALPVKNRHRASIIIHVYTENTRT